MLKFFYTVNDRVMHPVTHLYATDAHVPHSVPGTLSLTTLSRHSNNPSVGYSTKHSLAAIFYYIIF